MSEEAKVGLADEAIAVVSFGKKDGVKGQIELYYKYASVESDTDEFSNSLRSVATLSMHSCSATLSFVCLISSPSHSSIRILFCLRHFARPASRKIELRKNYLSDFSTIRNTRVFGDSRVNFTTKVSVVNSPSADWLGCRRT